MRRLYRAAQEANERYGMLFGSNPQPMWVFDADTLAFLEVNDAAVRHYGYSREEFLSMTIMDILPPEDAPGPAPRIGAHRCQRGDVALAQHQRKDGTIIDMELVSHEMELDGRRARLVLATDISERTRTRAALHQSEEQLRQAQRMDAAGRLAGGVAHDFNNLLTTIRGFSDLLLRDLPEEHVRRKDVEQIRKAAERGAMLTRQLLTFGRQPALEPRTLELNGVVTNMEGCFSAWSEPISSWSPASGRVWVKSRWTRASWSRCWSIWCSTRATRCRPEARSPSRPASARSAAPPGGARSSPAATSCSRSATPAAAWTGRRCPTSSSLLHLPAPGSRSGLGLSIVYGIVKQSGGGGPGIERAGAGHHSQGLLPPGGRR